MTAYPILPAVCPCPEITHLSIGELVMRRLRLFAALARPAIISRCVSALGLALFVSLGAAAQQSAVSRQRVPRLDTDDVVRPAATQPAQESKDGAAKTEEATKPGEPAATTAAAKGAEAK